MTRQGLTSGEKQARLEARRAVRRAIARDQLRAFYVARGRAPTAKEMGSGVKGAKRLPELPNYQMLVDLFGSARAGFAVANIPCRGVGRKVTGYHTADDVIQGIRAEYERRGRVPLVREASSLHKAAYRLCGDWQAAVTRAGYTPRPSGRTMKRGAA